MNGWMNSPDGPSSLLLPQPRCLSNRRDEDSGCLERSYNMWCYVGSLKVYIIKGACVCGFKSSVCGRFVVLFVCLFFYILVHNWPKAVDMTSCWDISSITISVWWEEKKHSFWDLHHQKPEGYCVIYYYIIFTAQPSVIVHVCSDYLLK